MAQLIVVDCQKRMLGVFVASATMVSVKRPFQLVLRHGLEMGRLPELLREELWGDEPGREPRKGFRSEMPILLMGSYRAQSSAGHVSVLRTETGSRHHHPMVVVGGLGPAFGKGGLRVLAAPIPAVLVEGPVAAASVPGAGNSNWNTAAAAAAGAKLLADIDRESVFVVEGQSDHVSVVRIRSEIKGAAAVLPVEHREEMFSQENIVRKVVFGTTFRSLARGRGDGGRPSEEEVRSTAKKAVTDYLAASPEERRERASWERLARRLSSLYVSDEVIARAMAEEEALSRAP